MKWQEQNKPPGTPIDRPVAAIGSDIQSSKRRPTPRPTLGKVLSKGGKQSMKAFNQKNIVLGCPINWRNQKTPSL